jgi:hypothetical protein
MIGQINKWRKIYVKEFQIIYVDLLPPGWHAQIPILKCDFFPKSTEWRRGKFSFVENSDQHYLSQVIKVSINSDKS